MGCHEQSRCFEFVIEIQVLKKIIKLLIQYEKSKFFTSAVTQLKFKNKEIDKVGQVKELFVGC